MVLRTLVVDAVKLGESGVGADQAGVSEESPDLFQRHGEGLFALVSLDLPGVNSVPVLQLGVVSQEDVLHLFERLLRVFFEFHEVGDVDELLERILLHFLFGAGGSESALSSGISESTAAGGQCRPLGRSFRTFTSIFLLIIWFLGCFRISSRLAVSFLAI